MACKYAVIDHGVVINIVVWDGESEWRPEEGEAVETTAEAGIGWKYDGNSFTPPPPPPLSKNELIVNAEQHKKSLLSIAENQIATLQDAVDLNMANEEEARLLVDWRKYRVLLNRISPQEPDTIVWPEQP